MLLLNRRKSQKIVIGEDIEIEITAVSKGNVLVGITAPKDIRVDRKEIREQKDASKNR